MASARSSLTSLLLMSVAGSVFGATVAAAQTNQPSPAGETPAVTPPAVQAPVAAQPPQPTTTPQTTPQPAAATAPPTTELPPVEVIQQQPKPPAAQPPKVVQKKKPAKPIQQAAPAPQPQPVVSPAPVAAAEPVDLPIAPISIDAQRAAGDIVRVSPLAGSEIAIEKVPGSVSTVSGDTLTESGTVEPQDVLQKQVPGVILGDAGGNDLRQQVDYRGFGAGSLNGFPQGLAVYQNGVRVNEVFGDTVNWDVLPKNAISDITILSGNPIFGLNAIGGAISVVMKDGFQFQGVEIDIMGGSYGRKQIGVQVGAQSGPFAAYFAGEGIEENGWRDFSPTEVKRAYVDFGFKGSRIEAHFNLTAADSFAGATAATPVEVLAIDRARTFTSPQTTDIQVLMPSFNASVKVSDTLTLSGLAYYRNFKSRVIDGNTLDGEECGDVLAENPGAVPEDPADPNFDDYVCSGEVEGNEVQALRDAFDNPIDSNNFNEPFGVIDRIHTTSESFGFSLQAVEKGRLFGLKNRFIAGASYDQGKVRYLTQSEFGEIGDLYVVAGSGIILAEPDDFAPRDVDVSTRYMGLYFLNALDLTDRLTLTVGGRFNHAKIDLIDLTGEFDGITSKHTFSRFNPTIGATYEARPGITLYAGYSEANRAPTPAELACANPDNPCPIESFLTDDPPLDQVVSKTFELGIRGKMRSADGVQRLNWGVGLFHTTNQDDILFVSSSTNGRGFFFNAGDTLRRGVEASLKYKYGPLSVYASYAYIKATYETAAEFSSPNNPFAGPCVGIAEDACINVLPGDNIPGIPNHRFKTGFDYFVTPKWKIGADLIAASGQHFFGDDANLLPKLGGYTRVDISTSYDVNENVQLYAFANNIFDAQYGLFGTLFDSAEAPADPAGLAGFTDPRSIVLGAPVAVYGGIKIKY
ncbi:MAG: TonB-dependent receptor [Hyphomicrobiaceae bacterium]|nr:TonB-dependent receptor [Hyphomicrobiaceae bacterium]